MTLVKEYKWIHVKTNTKGTSTFTIYHAHECGAVGHFNQFSALPEDAALLLVNKWNAQQPEEWKYWI